jgi:hypothetical protein
MKKFIAVIFILAGVILTFICIVKIPKIVRVTSRAIDGNSYDVGRMIGIFLFYGAMVGLIYLLFKYARKWLRKPRLLRGSVLDEHLLNDERDTTVDFKN